MTQKVTGLNAAEASYKAMIGYVLQAESYGSFTSHRRRKQTQAAVRRKVVVQDDVFHQMQEDFLISFVQKVNC